LENNDAHFEHLIPKIIRNDDKVSCLSRPDRFLTLP